MVKALAALCIVAVVQVCSAYAVAIPALNRPYGDGDIATQVVGGQEAARGQFPYQTSINVDNFAFCGGSLISKTWVLSAAICIAHQGSWIVGLGVCNIRSNNELGREVFETIEAFWHENYSRLGEGNDIGVIKLPREAILSDLINIIALPPRSLKDENLAGKVARFSGWGEYTDESEDLSPTLRFVDLNFVNLEECRDAYGAKHVTNDMYCIAGSYEKDTCRGDVGGPLTIVFGQNLTNIGILNSGPYYSCASGYPRPFTAVPHFVDWISNKTGIPVQDA